jgi:hypothetical protein
MVRPVVALLAVATFLVPSAASAGEATVVRSLERRDTFVVSGVECIVLSRQIHRSDGTVEMTTRGTSEDGTNTEACFYGVNEARVRYSYVDADGDPQSGGAVAPRFVRVVVPVGAGTDLQSFHGTAYFDGSRSPDYRLPK